MKKITKIQKLLDHYFPNPKFPLDYNNLFTLCIAVILSTQTSDAKVNKTTKELFKLASTPEEMLVLKKEKIAALIHSLGLKNKKAKTILKFSAILIEKYEGKIPQDSKTLQTLPGIGLKCAAVILAEGFKKPSFPVDTHVKRLALRWGLTKQMAPLAIEKDLKTLFRKKEWIKRHLQMISFGRSFCKAKGHNQKSCPICSTICL